MTDRTLVDEALAWQASGQQREWDLQSSQLYTRELARSHYENFPVVTLLLPRELRQPFADVYAFCRWADDLGDETDSTELSQHLLAWWREELIDCFAGSARHPVFVALRETLNHHEVPESLFHDLISAFEQDQVVKRYETFEDLVAYCRWSANPVGRILLHLAGEKRDELFQLSDDVCTGLQLINFWQDVSRDLDIGRIYLPEEDREQFGVTEEDLLADTSSSAVCRLIEFEVERAERYLKSGKKLAELAPLKIRFDLRLFAHGGLAIARKIRSQRFQVLEQRPRLRKSDLPRLFWNACFNCGWGA